MEPVVRARGAGRTFGRQVVLEGVDLELFAGEVLALCGPNGGGKSTLLWLLAGLVRPTTGSVDVDGKPAFELALAQSGAVGLITAEPGLYPLLTGRENLRFFGGLYGLGATAVDERSRDLLDRLGVTSALDRPVASYSSGMRQKVSLARALLMSPKVLLLDEPTANLDPVASHAIHAAVREQADRGVAVAMATHDLHAAEGFADRAAFVAGGIRRVERLEGERRSPDPGRLYPIYAELFG